MKSDYIHGGIAAIVLALLFPIYWLLEIGWVFEKGDIRTELGVLDVVYFVVGGLAAFVFFSLKRFLNERFAYTGADILLLMLMGIALVSYPVTWILGFLEMEFAFSAVFVGSLVAFGALDILLGVWLLRFRSELNSGLKTFAVFSILLGFCEITVFLSLAAVVVYPISLIILAIVFVREPEELQIV